MNLYFFFVRTIRACRRPLGEKWGRRRAFRYKSSLRSCLPCCGLFATIPHAGLRLHAFTGSVYHALSKPICIPRNTILINNVVQYFINFKVLNAFQKSFHKSIISLKQQNNSTMKCRLCTTWFVLLE